jgi:uncharacterized protein (TIGR02001 family)
MSVHNTSSIACRGSVIHCNRLHPCRSFICRALATAASVVALSTPPDSGAAEGPAIAGEVTVTTNYVSRGVSQTLSEPALQASLGFAHDIGLFAYVWGSNIDYVADGDPDDGARIEVDVVLEHELALTERIAATLCRLQYFNPGVNPGLDYDYGEWSGKLTLDDRHRVFAHYSDDIFGSGERALYLAAATAIDLSADLLLNLEIGRFDLSRARAWGDAYNYATLAISGGVEALTWEIAGHATNSHARNAFYASAIEPRAVLSLTYALW